MTTSLQLLASGTTTTPALSDAGDAQLLTAAIVGILVVVVLIVWAKFHPFLALMLGTATLGAIAAVAPLDIVTSFITGVGATFGSVGVLVALGAMLGKLLADSGGADVIVDTIIGKVGNRTLPWAMALIAAIIGLPMFFEIGVVILVPIIVLVALRTDNPLMRVGIPGLAGLSILHGLVPPHPGPVAAIGFLDAKLGYTLILGLIVAVPTLIISGPLLAMLITRLVPVRATEDHPLLAAAGISQGGRGRGQGVAGTVDDATERDSIADSGGRPGQRARREASGATLTEKAPDGAPRRRPGFVVALISIVLAVVLMLVGAIGELTLSDSNSIRTVTDFFGQPVVALLAAVLVAMFALGRGTGMSMEQVNGSLGAGLPGVAGILMIVSAGGGFKQVLSDSGVSAVIASHAKDSHISVLVLGWLVAVAIRLATGSATVAITTAAGIVHPLGNGLDDWHLSLLVLAVGTGSLFFSHVNDAGFWLVKEYFGLTVWQTIKSWSVMETVVSVVGFSCVLILNPIV
jgi:GntP family gluconate:H+ symporter